MTGGGEARRMNGLAWLGLWITLCCGGYLWFCWMIERRR
jgi:hypothetical protein